MPLRIYNTLRRAKEPFESLQPGKVRLYVCGVTVYDRCHIGHARANVAFDVVFRYLKFSGFEVTYGRDVTDVDHMTIKRANETKTPWQDLTRRYINEFTRDIKRLGNASPDLEPKATDHIPAMITLIERLIEKGLAYVSGGD